jgi:hypothetical protein
MTAFTVCIPNSVHEKIKELAAPDDISADLFIASAAVEKLASVLSLDYLKTETAKGSRKEFENYVAKLPNAVPQDGDPLPSK